MLNVNVIGTSNCVKEEMKSMKRGSSIVNCGSQQVRHALGLMSAYARRRMPFAACPKPRSTKAGPRESGSTCYVQPDEIAAPVVFLLGDESKFVMNRSAPIDYHDASGLKRTPIEDVYFISWYGSTGIRYEPKSTTPAATPLLLVNRQLHRETKDALERIPGRGRSYSLDFMLAKEELLWLTWTLVPAYAQHVDSIDVTVRVVGAMRVLPAFHKWNQWHSIFSGGDGGPPVAVWLFYSVLERFLKAGSVGRALDPKLGEYGRSGRCYSEEEATRLGFVDRKITVKHLNIDCVSPADEAVLADTESSRDWWYTRQLSGLVPASHTEPMDIQQHLRGVMRPE
ncbi:hypothetical protein DL764_007272 [Monosporascus ibericus]|uniref:Uncharacterized protein n=1 Tax=Monosporascus ibericus TaxID=155417 RepID=A0A4Q4T5P0_9PEZI|nr:hypothetical protein DL764_007272 [Monosporascus ibericus]